MGDGYLRGGERTQVHGGVTRWASFAPSCGAAARLNEARAVNLNEEIKICIGEIY